MASMYFLDLLRWSVARRSARRRKAQHNKAALVRTDAEHFAAYAVQPRTPTEVGKFYFLASVWYATDFSLRAWRERSASA